MKHNYSATYKNVILRPLKEEDIEMLRIWRNDISQTKFLTPIGEISPAMQKKWYNDYLNNPDEITFSIIETASLNRLVGSVALYHFKNGIAEIGKIQIGDREAHGLGLGKISLVMAMIIGFRRLRLSKIVSSVHQNNIPAYKNDMQVGFQVVGNHPAPMGGLEDELEICESRLIEFNPYALNIKIN